MPLRLKSPMPDLSGATKWLNDAPDLASLKGQPVLVYFWAVSCHICHDNMPKHQEWRDKFGANGLKMIAIHCPRQPEDTDVEKVKLALKEFGITEPCGVDNQHTVKKAFENELWPAYFLFDADGTLKRRAAGNAGVSMIEPILIEMMQA